MTTLGPLLAIGLPSLEMGIIAVLAACLPVTFFIWLNWWLSSVKDENPDEAIAEQARADQAHREHHGHGHGHGSDRHHAHA